MNRMERFANRPYGAVGATGRSPLQMQRRRVPAAQDGHGQGRQTVALAGGPCPNGDLSPWERGRLARTGLPAGSESIRPERGHLALDTDTTRQRPKAADRRRSSYEGILPISQSRRWTAISGVKTWTRMARHFRTGLILHLNPPIILCNVGAARATNDDINAVPRDRSIVAFISAFAR